MTDCLARTPEDDHDDLVMVFFVGYQGTTRRGRRSTSSGREGKSEDPSPGICPSENEGHKRGQNRDGKGGSGGGCGWGDGKAVNNF